MGWCGVRSNAQKGGWGRIAVVPPSVRPNSELGRRHGELGIGCDRPKVVGRGFGVVAIMGREG